MGVTAHFFAYDPHVQTTPPTMDGWLDEGALNREMNILDGARPWLREVTSYLGDNKRWYDNREAQFIWGAVRERVESAARQEIDRWLSHLFWAPGPGQGCACGREPRRVADGQTVYDDALLRHILSLEGNLYPYQAAVAEALHDDPTLRDVVERKHLLELDWFQQLVWERQAIIERATKAGPGWSLLQWVWI